MRILLALAVTAVGLAAPARAQELGWGRHEDARLGYAVGIPPGFDSDGAEQGAGRFYGADKGRSLWVAAGEQVTETFETEVAAQIRVFESGGWNISYQATTPRWATFTAVKGKQMLHARTIALCSPGTYAIVSLVYANVDAADMQATIERLDGSFQATEC